MNIRLKLAIGLCFCLSQPYGATANTKNPLIKWSNAWEAPKYAAANTSANSRFHSAWEMEFVYLLNLVRMNPPLFAKTVLQSYPDSSDPDLRQANEYKSLLRELAVLQPLGILQPDSLCWVSAKCHATTSGKNGYLGHERLTKDCENKMHFLSECIHYGPSTPLGALVSQLVDRNVPDLGHRRALLNPKFTLVGVSRQPHKGFANNVVINLYY
ncbi:MAG: CAP domain-containing protein [Bacteroidetes bacterium]|nr:MAG: CAP domain-containing protein [Bacteroidota bacterium]